MYPDDPDVIKVQQAFFDPFEYLWARHKGDALNTDFKRPWAVSPIRCCHQRVQNIGLKTRDVLNLVSESDVTAYERCSGHDGTYAVKKETRDKSVKLRGQPSARSTSRRPTVSSVTAQWRVNILHTGQQRQSCRAPHDAPA